MVRIDGLIFGYRKIKIPPDRLSEVTSLFIRSSLSMKIDSCGCIIARERDFNKIQELLSGRVDYQASESLGLFGKYKRLRFKKTLIFSLIFSLMLILFFSNIVWDVRIDGNQRVSDAEIRMSLSSFGLYQGRPWNEIDRDAIEAEILREDDRLSWINLNRRGTVAYVKVMEKEEGEERKEISGISNLVASCDCVIEEITVKKGAAVVKVGDVVKKGDLLIMGVESEDGGDFCAAEGVVIGRVFERISTTVSRNYKEKVLINRRLYSCDINFFNFSLNIFKLYGNLPNECDIIENEKSYSFLDGRRFPFSITTKYIPEYCEVSREYSDEELISVASQRLGALRLIALNSSDLLKMKTYGGFTEEGYELYSELYFLSDVTSRVEFTVE